MSELQLTDAEAAFDSNFKSARILVVDDDPDHLAFIGIAFKVAGYVTIRTESSSIAAAELMRTWDPDLIILDLDMPEKTGSQLLSEFVTWFPDLETRPPVVVVTGFDSSTARLAALQNGAIDVVRKPFDPDELLCRCSTYLRLRQLSLYRRLRANRLQGMVEERSQALVKAQTEILQRLASACELRDDITGRHTERVGILSHSIARELGLDEETCELMRVTAPLHDVGKVGIPDAILLKPGKLTEDEFAVMKTHTTLGAKILAQGDSDLVKMAAIIAESHHERWDGNGYPNGLSGETIPLSGRIVAVADVFDALTHERPYKRAMVESDAINLIQDNSGTQFDPRVVQAFNRVQAHCS